MDDTCKMSKKKSTTKEIWSNNLYGLKVTYKFSKSRVICSIIKQVIGYLMWVFYSAYFVKFVLDTIQNERPMKEILINIGIIGGISLVLQAYQSICNNIIFPLQNIKLYQHMYKKIYKKSQNVELECFENTEFYNKYSVALDGIGSKLGECVDNVSEIIGGLIGGIVACYAMIEIDPSTTIFLIAPLIGNFYFGPKMNRIYYNRYKDGVPYDRKIGYVNRVMYLSKYAKELRLYHIFNVIRNIFEDATEKKSNLWKKYFKKAYLYGILQYIFSYVIIFEGILLYGAYKAIVATNHIITFSEMAVLTSVMITASWIWVGVIHAYNRSSELGLVISDLKDFLEYKEKIPEDTDGLIPDKIVESIEFKNVSFSYDGVKNVIDHMSFVLHKEDKVALVGHNGAGKSTIIKLLLRFYDPSEGCILVNNIDIRQYNLEEYRKLFLCAFQDYEIFAATIKENVLMGREGTDQEVIEALKKADIYDKVLKLPKGIDTMLTKEFDTDGVLLSGGEFQKLVCARAFAVNANVSLFDEPSSALDPISENKLFNSIIKSVKHKMGIFISHRLSSVKDADYIFMLENGKIIEQGNHSELMKIRGAYYAMYKVQERNYFTYDADMVGTEV